MDPLLFKHLQWETIKMGMPGIQELLIVAAICLLLFGSRLPKVMGSLGQGITEFKKGVSGLLPTDDFTEPKE